MIEGGTPCTRCGSYADECDCCQEHDTALVMQALGMHLDRPLTWSELARARQVRIDTDNAALARALREIGYR